MAQTLVLVDADTVAGWRRATPSLDQLHSAVADLRSSHPEVAVAVLADPALKWSLAPEEQDLFETDVVERTVVCAPAGTTGGIDAWVEAVTTKARASGDEVLVVTDRAIRGVPVVRLSRSGREFSFDLASASEVDAKAAPAWRRRGGRQSRRRWETAPEPARTRGRPWED